MGEGGSFLWRERLWLWPLIAFLLITPFTADLDLAASHLFYEKGFSTNPIFLFIYNYGMLPAWIVALGSLGGGIAAFLLAKPKKWIFLAAFFVATMVIGPGIITHALFKEHWGRARPRQVVEFGGERPFRPYYKPNLSLKVSEGSKSFPSGHATMGFYFFSLVFAARRFKQKRLETIAWVLAFSLGGMLSLARIAQGGHFFSDTLMAALIMWEVAYFCDLKLLKDRECYP